MAKIRQSNLDNSIVTGLGDLGSNVSSADQIVVYDQSSGTLKKISQTNFLNFPVITSVSPDNVVSGDGTGNYTFTITGSGFVGASADLLNDSGTTVAFDSVTVDSATQITGVIAKSSLPNSGEPYDVRVTSAAGLRGTLDNQINIDASPVFTTASGSLGSQLISTAGSFSVNATDPESAGDVTFELQSGALPPGFTLTNTSAEGGTAIIAGTDSTTSTTTVFNFVLRAVDAASNTSSRAFSIQSRALASESFTSSGTFSVPSGITSADVLVVAGAGGGGFEGGGGGAGGLIFFPSYPVTPSGTITVTVGCGGAGAPSVGQAGTIAGIGQNSVFGSPGDPGLGQGGVLTTIGGGSGGTKNHPCAGGGRYGRSGGSGGGTGRDMSGDGGCGTQPTQPGNSGAYGFGNNGGRATGTSGHSAGGGGGAGAVGQNSFSPDSAGGPYPGCGSKGGIGKAYTIADGTTPVYYAGGGSGGGNTIANAIPGTQGGGGFGGSPGSGNYSGQPGQANKGGGGGGGGLTTSQSTGGTGGKGIVIVRY